jgi:hypothetical protein
VTDYGEYGAIRTGGLDPCIAEHAVFSEHAEKPSAGWPGGDAAELQHQPSAPSRSHCGVQDRPNVLARVANPPRYHRGIDDAWHQGCCDEVLTACSCRESRAGKPLRIGCVAGALILPSSFAGSIEKKVFKRR